MTNDMKYKIEIVEGNEHHSKIMDIYDENGSFYDSFKQAAQAVTEIVSLSNHFHEGNGKGQAILPVRSSANILSEYDNNIVSFCADRGQGKTSAMLSMADALKNLKSHSANSVITNFWNNPSMRAFFRNGNNPVLSMYFETLDLIDPTRMEKNDSIIRIIISKMFKAASEKWETYLNTFAQDRRNAEQYRLQQQKLAEKFLDCFKGLDYLYRNSETVSSSYDDLNMLAEYGDSNNFRVSFSELIRLYLEFMTINQNCRDTMLILLVDDADLNTKNAYAISEEIRKYCILPNVMVFMAVHIGTLSRSIEQYYLNEYQVLIQMGKDETVRERCHKIMEQYIDKLLPASHRIYLNSIYHSLRDEYERVKLSYFDRDKNDKLSGVVFANKSANTYEEQLIALIYRKTGIILTKSDLHLHDFLPDNFRELNHFIFYMTQMQDVIKEDRNGKSIGTIEHLLRRTVDYLEAYRQEEKKELIAEIDFQLNNLELFSNYFINTWCPLHLDSRQIKNIDYMRKSSRTLKNLRTIDILKEYSGEVSLKLKTCEQESLDYVPFSDVIFSLYQMTHSVNPIKYIHLAYAIRMYYTIYLHKIVLRSIESWLRKSKSEMENASPFRDLTDAMCGNFFPLFYREKKNLPYQLFRFTSGTQVISPEQSRLFKHFMCEGKEHPSMRSSQTEMDSSRKYVVDFQSEIIKEDGDGYRLHTEYQCFDCFKPFLTLLESSDFVSNFKMGVDNPTYYSLKVPCSLINLICNLDLMDLLYRRYFSKTADKVRSFSNGKDCYDHTEQVYKDMDKVLEQVLPEGVEMRLQFILNTPDNAKGFSLSDFAIANGSLSDSNEVIFAVYQESTLSQSARKNDETENKSSEIETIVEKLDMERTAVGQESFQKEKEENKSCKTNTFQPPEAANLTDDNEDEEKPTKQETEE